ncbi:hypothetical protein NECID01_1651 [Nematocida sp. AWRm77]|nr:hypothetical protein NECID01_1651 [Nematocida sp. AWRm77]
MEYSVDTTQRIFIRRHYVVCHTPCNRVMKIQLKSKDNIKPETSIKYYKYLSRKVGQAYLVEKAPGILSKESKALLERVVEKELSKVGTVMENLAQGSFARVSLSKPHRECPCAMCTPKIVYNHSVPLYIEVSPQSPFTETDVLKLVSLVLSKEKILEKIKHQETVYNKYGVETAQMLQRRFFGCYKSKRKMLGVKPFTLKGQWTKEKANSFFYSFKTFLALQNISFFINFKAGESAEENAVMYNDTPVQYTVKIHKIDIQSKRVVEKTLCKKCVHQKKWKLWI